MPNGDGRKVERLAIFSLTADGNQVVQFLDITDHLYETSEINKSIKRDQFDNPIQIENSKITISQVEKDLGNGQKINVYSFTVTNKEGGEHIFEAPLDQDVLIGVVKISPEDVGQCKLDGNPTKFLVKKLVDLNDIAKTIEETKESYKSVEPASAELSFGKNFKSIDLKISVTPEDGNSITNNVHTPIVSIGPDLGHKSFSPLLNELIKEVSRPKGPEIEEALNSGSDLAKSLDHIAKLYGYSINKEEAEEIVNITKNALTQESLTPQIIDTLATIANKMEISQGGEYVKGTHGFQTKAGWGVNY